MHVRQHTQTHTTTAGAREAHAGRQAKTTTPSLYAHTGFVTIIIRSNFCSRCCKRPTHHTSAPTPYKHQAHTRAHCTHTAYMLNRIASAGCSFVALFLPCGVRTASYRILRSRIVWVAKSDARLYVGEGSAAASAVRGFQRRRRGSDGRRQFNSLGALLPQNKTVAVCVCQWTSHRACARTRGRENNAGALQSQCLK